jgi:hypothetical protein
MKCIRLAVAIAGLMLTASAALAQSETQPIAQPPISAGPGVNIFEPLNPIPLANRVTQTNTYPDYRPTLGFDVGTFKVVPIVTNAVFYDDNVFALSSNRLSDWAYILRPELAIRSNNWNNAELAANAFVEKRWYNRFSSEDQVNGALSVAGSALLNPNTQIVGRAQYFHGHEERGSVNTVTNQFDRPVSYDQGDLGLALNNRWGRVWTSVGGSALIVRYDDATLAGVGISQDYRNGNVIQLPLRMGYVIAPSTSIFGEFAYNRRNFEVNAFDSEGYRLVGGILWEPGPGSRLKGEIYGGYLRQDYDGLLQPVSTWTAGAALAWIPATNWTVTFEARRDAREASLSGGVVPNDPVAVVQTLAAVRADYQIMPNFIVGAGISYIHDDLVGVRDDDSVSPLLSARYLLSRNFTLGFDYRHVDFSSNGLGVGGYRRNVYMGSINARF